MKAGRIIRAFVKACGADRLLPVLTQQKDVSSWMGKLTPENIQYRSGTTRHATRQGLHYELDISDYQEWLIYYGFTNDTPMTLPDLIKPDDHIMDIGANIGQTSLKLSKKISDKGCIWAFEPSSINFKKCQRNFQLNSLQNVHVFHTGVGAGPQKAFISSSNSHHRGSSHVSHEQSEFTEEITIIALDDFVKEQNCRVDLIKIDVEGYESEVIKGAEKTLREQKPVLFMEVDDSMLRSQNSSAKDLIAQLHCLNYQVFKDGTKTILSGEEDLNNCHMDIYALPVTTP